MQLIHVTQDDIDSGEQNSTLNCAIARAVKRQTNAATVTVSNTPSFLVDGSWYSLPLI